MHVCLGTAMSFSRISTLNGTLRIHFILWHAYKIWKEQKRGKMLEFVQVRTLETYPIPHIHMYVHTDTFKYMLLNSFVCIQTRLISTQTSAKRHTLVVQSV